MKNLLLLSILFCGICSAQTVNGKEINTDIVEVWAFAKPFSNKESYFADFGQKKFRPHYYDHKTQRINDDNGNPFEKGEWVALLSYMKEKGWVVSGERPANIGNAQGRIITFERS